MEVRTNKLRDESLYWCIIEYLCPFKILQAEIYLSLFNEVLRPFDNEFHNALI